MLKFIRKYNKILLVGFGVFLMIAFLLPSGIQQFQGDPRDRVVAKLGSRSVTMRDMMLASAEREAGIELMQRTGQAQLAQMLGTNAEHWLLLSAAAERAGLVGRREDGRNFLFGMSSGVAQSLWQMRLNQWFSEGMQGETPSQEGLAEQADLYVRNVAQYAASKGNLSGEQMELLLAKLSGVARLFQTYATAAAVSEPAAKIAAKEALDTVEIEYVVVPGARLASEVPEPTSDDLQAHFETFREVAREEGDLGIGYVLGPRVRLEWLKIDRDNIRSAMYVSDIRAAAEYEANAAKYPGTPAEGVTAAANALRDLQTDAAVREAARLVRGEIRAKIDALGRQGGYRVVPDGWKRPSMEEIAEDVYSALKAEGDKRMARWVLSDVFERPSVVRRDASWLTMGELATLPGIGQGRSRVGTRDLTIAQLVSQAREIAGESDLGLQVGVPAIDFPVQDEAGNIYFFTILDARGTSPAESLDEVRDMAVQDFKSLAGYRRLEGMLPDLIDMGEDEGVQAVADSFPASGGVETGAALVVQQGSVRRDGADDPIIDTEELRARVFELSSAIDPLRPVEEIPGVQRTFGLTLPKSRSVVVGRITRVVPTTNETFRRDVERYVVAPMLMDAHVAASEAGLPFDLGPLRKRMEYVPKAGESSNEEEEPVGA